MTTRNRPLIEVLVNEYPDAVDDDVCYRPDLDLVDAPEPPGPPDDVDMDAEGLKFTVTLRKMPGYWRAIIWADVPTVGPVTYSSACELAYVDVRYWIQDTVSTLLSSWKPNA